MIHSEIGITREIGYLHAKYDLHNLQSLYHKCDWHEIHNPNEICHPHNTHNSYKIQDLLEIHQNVFTSKCSILALSIPVFFQNMLAFAPINEYKK